MKWSKYVYVRFETYHNGNYFDVALFPYTLRISRWHKSKGMRRRDKDGSLAKKKIQKCRQLFMQRYRDVYKSSTCCRLDKRTTNRKYKANELNFWHSHKQTQHESNKNAYESNAPANDSLPWQCGICTRCYANHNRILRFT